MDHVPPRSVFPEDVRSAENLSQLITLPSHDACNSSFSQDEEYFLYSVTPIAAPQSRMGRIAFDGVRKRLDQGKSVGLGFKVLKEFTDRPGGLYLPRDRVLKHIDRVRADRVVFKVVRGLHYHEGLGLLPEKRRHLVELVGPLDELDDQWDPVLTAESRGVYPAIFDWKLRLMEKEGFPVRIRLWALLYWDSVMAFVAHHDLACACGDCEEA
ncbi:MAG: hypothetical protein Q8P50_04110 [Bacillota bacterium]|nr:hypothetical protein [Bacillota bacterium]